MISARDQREWVFEVREVKSEIKKLSLFFEKCKVKQKCFQSFFSYDGHPLARRDKFMTEATSMVDPGDGERNRGLLGSLP